jgi:hypothetical protein
LLPTLPLSRLRVTLQAKTRWRPPRSSRAERPNQRRSMDMGTGMAWSLALGAHWHTREMGTGRNLARFVFVVCCAHDCRRHASPGWLVLGALWVTFFFACDHSLPLTPIISYRQMWEEVLGLSGHVVSIRRRESWFSTSGLSTMMASFHHHIRLAETWNIVSPRGSLNATSNCLANSCP